MNLKKLGVSSWVDFIRSSLLLLLLVGGTLVAGGDFRWVTLTDFATETAAINQKITLASTEQTQALKAVTAAQKVQTKELKLELLLFRIDNLDARITFLTIKVEQNEATSSEKIILPTLERQLRQLKRSAE